MKSEDKIKYIFLGLCCVFVLLITIFFIQSNKEMCFIWGRTIYDVELLEKRMDGEFKERATELKTEAIESAKYYGCVPEGYFEEVELP